MIITAKHHNYYTNHGLENQNDLEILKCPGHLHQRRILTNPELKPTTHINCNLATAWMGDMVRSETDLCLPASYVTVNLTSSLGQYLFELAQNQPTGHSNPDWSLLLGSSPVLDDPPGRVPSSASNEGGGGVCPTLH